MSMISINQVSKSFYDGGQTLDALKEISLEIQKGESVAIVGTSGSGKTTLLNLMGGLDRDFKGEISLDQQPLHPLSDQELSQLRNQKIGFIFQNFCLLDHLSVLDNVTLGACFAKEVHKQVDLEERARTLLNKVGLSNKLHAYPTQLSGGQKQRVAIARALLFNPPILLCDEPTGSLDGKTGQAIIDLFKDLHKEGYTVILITHEERVSKAVHRIIRLEDGVVVEDQSQSDQGDI
jgi:putative ABC transport system ATP-binding protein